MGFTLTDDSEDHTVIWTNKGDGVRHNRLARFGVADDSCERNVCGYVC